ncbi:MAG: hemerythrin family protein [Spirochaetes bacterium]|nr:hemerythrin family protein [Spirochaetota bacterium]MBP9022476.1 hemerythrin family protein [Spirochaetota bacterium]
MAYIEWEDSFSVGVDIFDNEHKKLIEIINRLHLALLMKETDAVMGKTLKDLIDYTITHFAHEEENMANQTYPDFFKHKKEHDELIKKVQDYKMQIESGKTTISLSIMNFLKEWLMSHILGTDMKYRNFFAGKNLN